MHLHTTLGNVGEDTAIIIRLICRWAVPFFFISAGYYLGKKHQQAAISLMAIRGNLINLIGIFLVVNMIYIAFSLASGYVWFSNDIKYLFVGSFWHLWFIGSMIFGYILIWFIDEILGRQTLYACGVTVLLSCIFISSCSSLLPIHISYQEIPRFISGFAFMVLGMMLTKLQVHKFNKLLLISLLIVAISIIFLELHLSANDQKTNYDLEMSVGIASMATLLFLLSQAFSIKENRFSSIGKRYALFIYLYHVLVFKLMIKGLALLQLSPAPYLIFFPILALLIILSTVYLLERNFGRVFDILNGKLRNNG